MVLVATGSQPAAGESTLYGCHLGVRRGRGRQGGGMEEVGERGREGGGVREGVREEVGSEGE